MHRYKYMYSFDRSYNATTMVMMDHYQRIDLLRLLPLEEVERIERECKDCGLNIFLSPFFDAYWDVHNVYFDRYIEESNLSPEEKMFWKTFNK